MQACTGRLAVGCTNLGSLYDEGMGVAKDETRAAGLYQQGCTGGGAEGCYNLGYDYEIGAGVAKDTARALQLYRRVLTLVPDLELAGDANARIDLMRAAPVSKSPKHNH